MELTNHILNVAIILMASIGLVLRLIGNRRKVIASIGLLSIAAGFAFWNAAFAGPQALSQVFFYTGVVIWFALVAVEDFLEWKSSKVK